MLIKKKYEKNLNRKILTKFNSLKNSIKKEPRKILKSQKRNSGKSNS